MKIPRFLSEKFCGNKEKNRRIFERNYASPVYGFENIENSKKMK